MYEFSWHSAQSILKLSFSRLQVTQTVSNNQSLFVCFAVVTFKISTTIINTENLTAYSASTFASCAFTFEDHEKIIPSLSLVQFGCVSGQFEFWNSNETWILLRKVHFKTQCTQAAAMHCSRYRIF